jgi:hypothetical protein
VSDWDSTELPLERSGYRWRFFVGGLLGIYSMFVLVRAAFWPDTSHHGEPDAWAVAGVLFVTAPLSISFLVSGVGVYRGWSYGVFFRVLPAALVGFLLAGLLWLDC